MPVDWKAAKRITLPPRSREVIHAVLWRQQNIAFRPNTDIGSFARVSDSERMIPLPQAVYDL